MANGYAKALKRFEEAVEALAFKGVQMPEDHPYIESEYEKAKYAFLAQNEKVAQGLLDIAALAIPDTFFANDSRVKAAKEILAALNALREDVVEKAFCDG